MQNNFVGKNEEVGLGHAHLQGAELTGADLEGASLRAARVWRTRGDVDSPNVYLSDLDGCDVQSRPWDGEVGPHPDVEGPHTFAEWRDSILKQVPVGRRHDQTERCLSWLDRGRSRPLEDHIAEARRTRQGTFCGSYQCGLRRFVASVTVCCAWLASKWKPGSFGSGNRNRRREVATGQIGPGRLSGCYRFHE
jgi:uncharacterized protein YjbI with pentapeptide repeats